MRRGCRSLGATELAGQIKMSQRMSQKPRIYQQASDLSLARKHQYTSFSEPFHILSEVIFRTENPGVGGSTPPLTTHSFWSLRILVDLALAGDL